VGVEPKERRADKSGEKFREFLSAVALYDSDPLVLVKFGPRPAYGVWPYLNRE
jgi:hypothetical protein